MQKVIIVVAAVIFLVAGLLAGLSYKRLFLSPEEEPQAASTEQQVRPSETTPTPSTVQETIPQPEQASSTQEQAPEQKPKADEKPPVEVMEELIETQFQEIENLKAELAQLRGDYPGAVDKEDGSGPLKLVYRCQELFNQGQVDLSDKGLGVVRELAKKVMNQQKYSLMICGHTDDSALGRAKSKAYGDNLGLSVARALEVARELFNQGVPAELIAVCGYGDARPEVPNNSQENMAQNRRVVVTFQPRPPR